MLESLTASAKRLSTFCWRRRSKSLHVVSGKEGRKGKGLSTVSPALIASPRPSPAVAPQCSAFFTPLLVGWPAK